MPLPIHTGEDLSIMDMVLNRLKFLLNTPENTAILSIYTIEIMSELEQCFRVDKDLPIVPPDTTNIGNENKYTLPQRVVIADLVCVYVLMAMLTGNMAGTVDGNGDPVAPSPKVLTRTKAGSVEVEWEQFDVKKGAGLYTTSESLMDIYKKSAIRKARALGCIIDICGDCSLAVELMMDAFLPFKVISGLSCSGGCDSVPERNLL